MLYRFDDCELDDRLYQLRRQGQRVEIEPKAFDLLVYLLRQRPVYSLELERQGVPYKNPADLERYLDGLRKAGLK